MLEGVGGGAALAGGGGGTGGFERVGAIGGDFGGGCHDCEYLLSCFIAELYATEKVAGVGAGVGAGAGRMGAFVGVFG